MIVRCIFCGGCIFCGSEEETDQAIENPVCERAECTQSAKEWGWRQLLGQFIESKTVNGQTMFRLKENE